MYDEQEARNIADANANANDSDSGSDSDYISMGRVRRTNISWKSKRPCALAVRPDQHPFKVEPTMEVTVLIRAFDLFLEPGRESDLPKRFPGLIPRFWHQRDSELIVVDTDKLDPSKHYLCLEIPVSHPSTHQQDNQDDANGDEKIVEPPSKRAKTSSYTPQSTMKVYIPHFLGELYGIASAAESLKNSARPSAVLFGFIISALGGVLHLSYPPTIDEAKLYCEVISLFEHHDIAMGEIIPTFAHVLNSLGQPHPVPIAPQTQSLDELFEFVWVMCSQSRTCLGIDCKEGNAILGQRISGQWPSSRVAGKPVYSSPSLPSHRPVEC